MSNLAQFKGASLPIGTPILSPAVGDTYTDGSAEVWLQSGKGVSPASAPLAALLDHLKVNGIAATGVNPANVIDLASDTTGQYWVAVNSDTTNVIRSADGGATWANVAHNLTVAATTVKFGGGKFVVAGNDTSAIRTSRSADNGATFTVNSTTAVSSAAASTARMDYGNSLFVVAVAGTSSTGPVATSSDGIAFSAQNVAPLASGFGTFTGVCWIPSASLWVFASSNASNWLTSATALTGSFTQRTGPFVAATAISIAANTSIGLAHSSGSTYYTTTDAITWTARTAPISATSTAAPIINRIRQSGGVFFMPLTVPQQMAYGTDGITWKLRWISAATQAGIGFATNGKMAILSTGTANTVYSATWNTCDYVGSTVAITASNSAGTPNYASPMVYWRIA